ncbi:hypothetical protein F4860DRAFT_524386 [Xylaria cubensis]|nr:hypothetical protein F4860DRAFT_524386 [Xylaria cubensis]
MFQTLKARRTNTGESAYVVQSSGIPFEKDKVKKPRACAFCKLKKLKCVADGDSCVKCSKQGLECSYRNAATSSPSSSRRPSRCKTETRTLPPTGHKGGPPEPLTDNSPSDIIDQGIARSSLDSTPALPDLEASAGSSTTPNNEYHSVHGDLEFSGIFSSPGCLDGDVNIDLWEEFCSQVNVGISMPVDLTANGTTDCRAHATKLPSTHTPALPHIISLDPSHSAGREARDNEPAVPFPLPQHDSSASPEPITPKRHPGRESRPSAATQFPDISSALAVAPTDYSRIERCEMIRQGPPPISCRCLEQLMSANEAMQVKLVWTASAHTESAVNMDDMLQCQKDMLASCGNLLACHACSLRSGYVMLVVSMCREMISAITDLGAIILYDSQHGSRKRTRSEAADGSWASIQRVNTSVWRLDDQDEMAVIKSLIRIRIARLGNLITRLESVVQTHHHNYGWIVSALRQNILEKIDPIESEINKI